MNNLNISVGNYDNYIIYYMQIIARTLNVKKIICLHINTGKYWHNYSDFEFYSL